MYKLTKNLVDSNIVRKRFTNECTENTEGTSSKIDSDTFSDTENGHQDDKTKQETQYDQDDKTTQGNDNEDVYSVLQTQIESEQQDKVLPEFQPHHYLKNLPQLQKESQQQDIVLSQLQTQIESQQQDTRLTQQATEEISPINEIKNYLRNCYNSFAQHCRRVTTSFNNHYKDKVVKTIVIATSSVVVTALTQLFFIDELFENDYISYSTRKLINKVILIQQVIAMFIALPLAFVGYIFHLIEHFV